MVKFIDLHCDTLTKCFETSQNLYENNLHIDIKKINNFMPSVQVYAIWLKKSLYKNGYTQTKNIIDFFDNQILKNQKYISKATNFNDILKNQKLNKHSAILSIEGFECLMGDLNKIDDLFQYGVRMASLCWNYENDFGYGAWQNQKLGLKDLGKLAIKKLNSLNIIIDVSHLNEAGFWDVYNISEKPFLASHSNCFSLCNNSRNLKDEQIKAIKDKNGLIGINLYKNFLTNSKLASIDDIYFHINHIAKLIGFENICLGGDLDGIDDMPQKIENLLGYKVLFNELKNKFSLNILEKIFFENAYNFFKNNF